MYCVIIAVLFVINSMQAVQLGRTLTPEELVTSDRAAQNWFRDQLHQRKEELARNAMAFLPRVLIPLIQVYESPYVDMWQTVEVANLVGAQRINCPLEALRVDVPLRYKFNSRGQHVMFKLSYKDIFQACGGLLNRPMSRNRWGDDIKSPLLKCIFRKFISNVLSRKLTQPLHDNVIVHFPNLDYWPLAVYWDQEHTVLPKMNLVTRGRVDRCLRSDAIDKSCYDILQLHGKLPQRATKEDLIIVCTTCNGCLKRPDATLHTLTLRHQSSYCPRYCTGQHPRCRTYRALRVFVAASSLGKRKQRS